VIFLFENVSVLIPYKPDGGPRDEAFKWVKDFYKIALPGAEICVGTTNDPLFNRSKAINLAAKQAKGDVFIIIDGDIIFDPAIIEDSLRHIDNHSYVFPFKYVKNIAKETTSRLLAANPTWPLNEEILNYDLSTRGRLGKVNIIKRENFEFVGGFDERFQGWGGEDIAFNCAVTTLCGRAKRLKHAVYHLWHPSMNFRKNPNGQKNIKHKRKYQAAKGNKEEMWKLVHGE
jgi:glycosyltransferase involved in cell wall biosynthesis